MTKLSVYSDGGARGNPGPAASAFVIKNEEGKVLSEKGKYLGVATNNVAEYMGVVMALKELVENFCDDEIEGVDYHLDSNLVVQQLNGKFKVKNEKLRELVHSIKVLEKRLPFHVLYRHVPRARNKDADFLVNQTIDAHLQHVK